MFVALRQITETLPSALPVVQSRILTDLADILAGPPAGSTEESEEVVRLSLAALGKKKMLSRKVFGMVKSVSGHDTSL